MIDAWQIYYARVNGADAILLIAAILPDLDIKYMTKICKMFGLTALVEVWLLSLTTSCTMMHRSVFDFMIVFLLLFGRVTLCWFGLYASSLTQILCLPSSRYMMRERWIVS